MAAFEIWEKFSFIFLFLVYFCSFSGFYCIVKWVLLLQKLAFSFFFYILSAKRFQFQQNKQFPNRPYVHKFFFFFFKFYYNILFILIRCYWFLPESISNIIFFPAINNLLSELF